jgi:antitoxin component of MazEF toxin-antitoxin module
MSKLTADLQVTMPRALVDRLGLRPGDEIEWVASGETLQAVPMVRRPSMSLEARLELFDQATQRQREREARRPPEPAAEDRGWTREELYDRGLSH